MGVVSIEVEQARDRLAENGDSVILLDCREHHELDQARICGALHIPMGEIPDRLDELDPECEIIVFCHHGVRSVNVAHFLAQRAFEKVVNMSGGIEAWSRRVDANVPLY